MTPPPDVLPGQVVASTSTGRAEAGTGGASAPPAPRETQAVWVVVWRDGAAVEGVSVYDQAHAAVEAIVGVIGERDEHGLYYEQDAHGRWTGAEPDVHFEDCDSFTMVMLERTHVEDIYPDGKCNAPEICLYRDDRQTYEDALVIIRDGHDDVGSIRGNESLLARSVLEGVERHG